MVQGLTWTPGFGEGTEWTDGFSGAGAVDTVAGLVKAVQDKNDAAIAAYSVGLAFDVIGAALNPLGAVIGAGVGWLIDHIAFLREPLDLLVGDNIAIRQETEKVKNDAGKYEGIASTHLEALKKLDGWMGETADRFRATMAQVAKEIEAIGSAINASAKLMATMGAVVTAVRSLVRDIIAMVIGNLIGGALIAAGLAPITFGASIVAFIGTAVATALEALSRIMRHVTNLKSVLTGASKSADDLGEALVKMSDDAARFGKGGGSADVPTPPPVKGPSTDAPTVKGGDGATGGGAKPPGGDTVSKPPEVNGGGGASGSPKPGAADTPPVQKPPEVGGGSGGASGGGKVDTPDTPPVSKPPEVGGGGTSTSSVKPPEVPPINTGKPPQDIPLPPSPGAGKPPQDIPLPPSPVGGGSRPPSPVGGAGGGKPTPPPINTGKPPQDIPLPPSPGGGSPKPDVPSGSGAPKPDAPPTSGGPKPDDAAPKPPGSDAPGTGGAGGGQKPPFSWAEVKNHVDDLSKYGKEHLENVLTTKFGKTPEEAKDISQWIKNFEELAAPGGHFTVAGKAFATGTGLHLVHELWKELSADTHAQKEDAGFLGDLKDYNATH